MNRHNLIAISILFIAAFATLHVAAAPPPTRMSFESGGRKIAVDFYAPAVERSTHRAILVLHGAGGTLFDGPEMRRMSQRLAADGHAVYLVHYFDRTGSYFFASNAGLFKNFETWLDTIRDAVKWVGEEQARANEQAQPIGIYGYSLGAFLAVAAASDNHAVGAIAEQAGGIWNNEQRRIGHMPPALLIHGRADARVEFEKYEEPLTKLLRQHGTPYETLYFAGEGHGFSSEAQAQTRERVAGFFRRKLPSR